MHTSIRKVLFVAFAIVALLVGVQSAWASGPGTTRQLAASQVQVKVLEKKAHKHQSVINWWNNGGKWALGLKHGSCSEFQGVKRRKVCNMARRSLAYHSQHVKLVERKLASLSTSVPAYKNFSTCTAAVNYLFAGRSDQQRAQYVVRRESSDKPWATNGSYWGCGQISWTMRRGFLSGPWDNAFYNVLAMRRAVDNPSWGWCHWDIVNYCSPGGEW